MKNKYRDCGLEVPTGYKIPGSRMTGEKRIIITDHTLDYSCFKKTPEERLSLKIAKGKVK
jgi:hypothetical protein